MITRVEIWGWRIAGFLAALIAMWLLYGCAAPQTKAEGGSTKWEKTTAPASVVSEKNIDEIIAAADGSTITRKVGERTTAPPVTVTERAESKGPSVQGPGAEKAKLGPSTAGPDGARAGEADATWRKVIPPGKEWILLIIGGVALVAGVVLAVKLPALALGWPLAAGGAACVGVYFYPWAVLAGAAVWYAGDLWQSRRTAKTTKQAQAAADEAEAEAARQREALAVVTRAVANSDAATKAAIKRKVADTIASGSDLDAAIQGAKRA